MRFVHIADMHFDVPFTSLSFKRDLCEKRRLEQRDVFKKIIEYIKHEKIPYLFISGDLHEHEYVRKSTIDYINNLFKEIPNTKIFISPGNHDPYIKDSYYDTYDFSENVYIFRNSRLEKYEDENVNIFGVAFTDFYMNNSPFEKIAVPFSVKPNILLAHVDLDGTQDTDGKSYNAISESRLSALGFDYCAIGHIHKKKINNQICYPGSTIALGFDELGEHGMVVGNIFKNNIKIDFLNLDDREFKEENLNVESMSSEEELIEKINSLNLEEYNLYKINLIGKRNFEIDSRKILRLLNISNVLKIKDSTETNYNIEELASKNNLKGLFVKEVVKAYNNGDCTEEEFKKILEIGLNAM